MRCQIVCKEGIIELPIYYNGISNIYNVDYISSF